MCVNEKWLLQTWLWQISMGAHITILVFEAIVKVSICQVKALNKAMPNYFSDKIFKVKAPWHGSMYNVNVQHMPKFSSTKVGTKDLIQD